MARTELTPEQRVEAQELIDELQTDEVQRALRPGFELDFANSIIPQWEERHWMSTNQLESLRSVVSRHRDHGRRSTRRYEGWTPSSR